MAAWAPVQEGTGPAGAPASSAESEPMGGPAQLMPAPSFGPLPLGAPTAPVPEPAGVGRAVVVLLALCGAADVFWAAAELLLLSAADEQAADRAVSLRDWTEAGQGFALLACAITFMVWLSRSRARADWLAPHQQRLSGAWIFWGWVVPVVNFWYPRRIVVDIWRASVPAYSAPRFKGPGLVNAWWACWLCSLVLDPFWEGPPAVGLACTAFDLAAAVLAAFVVREVTLMQRTKGREPHPLRSY